MAMLLRIKQICLFTLLLPLLVSCSRSNNYQAAGYIEGRYTYIATSVSGMLEELFVERGSRVKKGAPLFVLEPQPESDTYAAALENLNQTLAARDAIAANLTFAKLTYERYQVLVPKHAIEQSALDNAKSIYNSTLAQLSQANANIAASKANLAQANWVKEQKTISSPIDGLVFDTYYRLGEYTVLNQPILSLLAPENIKVIFYVNEAALHSIKLNENVSVHCDGCAKPYIGKISFISPSAEYTPPVIFSTETNAKLVFRIEARFTPQDAFHLHPGQPVTVFITPHE